jgi:hypothetical protein
MNHETGLKWLIVVVSVILLLYGSQRLSRGRLRVEAAVPLVVDPPPDESADSPKGRSVLAQRARTLRELDTYAEPGQTLARQWFWHHAGMAPMKWDEPGCCLPAHTLAGTWYSRWMLGRKLAYVRRLAQDGTALSMSGRRFRKLHVRLRELTRLVCDGKIVWIPEL